MIQSYLKLYKHLVKCKNKNLLRAAEVNPVLPVTIKATGASEEECTCD